MYLTRRVITIASKESKDMLFSWRFILLGLLLIVLSIVSVYVALHFPPPPNVAATEVEMFLGLASSVSGLPLPVLAVAVSFSAISGEFKSRTLLQLLARPIHRWQIVIGKFIGYLTPLAIVEVITVLLGLILVVSLSKSSFCGQNWGGVAFYFLSLLLMVAFYLAIGIFLSVLTRDPKVSAVSALLTWAAFFFAGAMGDTLGIRAQGEEIMLGIHPATSSFAFYPWYAKLLKWLDPITHVQAMAPMRLALTDLTPGGLTYIQHTGILLVITVILLVGACYALERCEYK
jgi:Cu-processing system permease protein